MTTMNLKDKMIETYSKAANAFVSSISSVKYDRIPEPFLPVFGSKYQSSSVRMIFVGIETNGYGNITDFVNHSKNGSNDFLFRGQYEFDTLKFLNWGSNFGNDFWGFVLQYLARYYEIEDWNLFKKGEHQEILRSFVWGNSNSIERYEVTAKGSNVPYEEWQRVKASSEVLDRGKYLLEVFSPEVMIILNWGLNDQYFDGLKISSKEEIEDHLLKVSIEGFSTQVFLTPHPNWLNKNKDFSQFVMRLAKMAKR